MEFTKKVDQDFPRVIFYDIAVRNDDSIEIPSLDPAEKFRECLAIIDRARSLQLVGEAESPVALGF